MKFSTGKMFWNCLTFSCLLRAFVLFSFSCVFSCCFSFSFFLFWPFSRFCCASWSCNSGSDGGHGSPTKQSVLQVRDLCFSCSWTMFFMNFPSFVTDHCESESWNELDAASTVLRLLDWGRLRWESWAGSRSIARTWVSQEAVARWIPCDPTDLWKFNDFISDLHRFAAQTGWQDQLSMWLRIVYYTPKIAFTPLSFYFSCTCLELPLDKSK